MKFTLFSRLHTDLLQCADDYERWGLVVHQHRTRNPLALTVAQALHLISTFKEGLQQIAVLELLIPFVTDMHNVPNLVQFFSTKRDVDCRLYLLQVFLSVIPKAQRADADSMMRQRALVQKKIFRGPELARIKASFESTAVLSSNSCSKLRLVFEEHGLCLTAAEAAEFLTLKKRKHASEKQDAMVEECAEVVAEICVGLRCVEVAAIIASFANPTSRLNILKALWPAVVDPHKKCLLQFAFQTDATSTSVANDARLLLLDGQNARHGGTDGGGVSMSAAATGVSARTSARCEIWGTVKRGDRTIFVLENSSSFTDVMMTTPLRSSRYRVAARALLTLLSSLPEGFFSCTIVLFNKKGERAGAHSATERGVRNVWNEPRLRRITRRRIDEIATFLLSDTSVCPPTATAMTLGDALQFCDRIQSESTTAASPLSRVCIVTDSLPVVDYTRLRCTAAMHPTLLLVGRHASDHAERALRRMVVLAQQTGGFARVLHSTDATFSESQRTKDDKSEDARRIEPTRRALGFICLRTRFNPCSRFFGHRKEMPPATKSVAMSDAMINIIRASQLWGVASCFAFLLSLLISLESPTFGGHTCGELAMLFPSWASSPVITFSLWRVLLIGLACALGLLASPSQLQRVYTAYAATYLGVYCILGAIALPLMQWEMFELSFLCLATQIFVLLSLYDLLAIGTHARGLFIEFFTDCVVSALIPWTVHILAQLGAAWTTRNQVVHVGWSYEWVILAIIILSFFAVTMLVLRRDLVGGAVCVWIVGGSATIWARDMQTPRSAKFAGFSPAFKIVSTAAFSLSALAVALTVIFAIRRADALIQTHGRNLSRWVSSKLPRILRLQSVNGLSYFFMIIISFFSMSHFSKDDGTHIPTGSNLWGLSEPPLNGMTCGAIAFNAGHVLTMPSSFVFRIWWVIYALLGVFTASQALPFEFNRWTDEDDDARRHDHIHKQRVFVRGLDNEWCRCFVDLKCISRKVPIFACPIAWRWKLTYEAQTVLYDHVSWWFSLSNFCSVGFTITFHYELYFLSTLFLFALLVLLIVINNRVNTYVASLLLAPKKAAVSTLQKKKTQVGGDDDGAVEYRGGKRGGSGNRKKNMKEDEKRRQVEIARLAAKAAEESEETKAAKPKKQKRERYYNANQTQFSWYFIAVQAPFGLYLGWVSFLTLPAVGHAVHAYTAPAFFQRTVISEFYITLIILLLITAAMIAGVLSSLHGTANTIAIGYAWGVVGVAYECTLNSCRSTTMAGTAYRHDGLMLHWNTNQGNCTSLRNYAWSKSDGLIPIFKCRMTMTATLDECNSLGKDELQGGQNRKGFSFIDHKCVERAGTCPYQPLLPRPDSHTPQWQMATSMFAIGFIFILLAFAMPVLAYVQQKPNYRPMALMLGAVVGSVISFGALAVAYELPGGW